MTAGASLPPADVQRGDCSSCGRKNQRAEDICPAFPAELGGPHVGWRAYAPADEPCPAPPLTEEDLVEMEEGYRGTVEQLARACKACADGWKLIRVVEAPWGSVHAHLAPWDDGDADRHPNDDFAWEGDPRPDIRRLIADLRASRAEVERLRGEMLEER